MRLIVSQKRERRKKARPRMSDKAKILEYLKAGHTVTGLDGLKLFGTLALRNRIGELRKEGYNIKSEMVSGANGKHYSKYWLVEDPKPTELESAVIHSNHCQEELINFQEVSGQMSFIK